MRFSFFILLVFSKNAAHHVGQTYFIHIVSLIFENMMLMYNKYICYSLVYFHPIIVLCRQLLI